jgi:hypothetical protein
LKGFAPAGRVLDLACAEDGSVDAISNNYGDRGFLLEVLSTY